MKPQIVVIHGGVVYDTQSAFLHALKTDPVDISYFQRQRKWKDRMEEELGEMFEILRPEMPSHRNAHYEEWCIWFERMIPFLRDGVVLVGHSLGAVFLARYMNDYKLPITPRATVLIAPPFDDESVESLGEFRIDGALHGLNNNGGEIHIWGSEDDSVVPQSEIKKYQALLPNAHVRMFTDKGHFSLETFPELYTLLRQLASS